MLYRNVESESWINYWVSGPVHWVWLGWRELSSQEPAGCCVLDPWPKHAGALPIAEQCSHGDKAFSFLPRPYWQRRQEAGRGHSRDGWPKEATETSPVPCNAVLSNKTGVREIVFQSSHCSDIGWASVCWWEVVSDGLCITWLVLSFFSWFFCSFNVTSCLYHNPQEFSCFCPFDSLPSPPGREGARDRVGAYLPTRVNPPQHVRGFPLQVVPSRTRFPNTESPWVTMPS